MNITPYKRKMAYTIYATHGSGGGRKEGGKINRLADYAQIVDADVMFAGTRISRQYSAAAISGQVWQTVLSNT